MSAPWAAGTVLQREPEPDETASAWDRVVVGGVFDRGYGYGAEVVIQPVAWAAGEDCSPRAVDASLIATLGYVVAEAADAAPWETPINEASR